MNRFCKNLIFFLFLTIFISVIGGLGWAEAATYYVRTDGNNSCNGTTDSSGSSGNCAFRTILKGLQTAQAGDTITVHAGSYTGETLKSQRSGLSGSPITLQAYTGETVTISRIDIPHSYNALSGLTINSYGSFANAGISVTGNNNTISGNRIIGACDTCGSGGETPCTGMYLSGSNNLITNNIFDGMNNGTSTGFGQAIYIAVGSSSNTMTHNTIKNANTPGRLFEFYGDGHRFASNEVFGSVDRWCSAVHADIFQGFGSPSSNMLIEDNYFHDMDSQWVMLADCPACGGQQGVINHWTFRNNVFANITQSGFIKSSYISFHNNTFYNVGSSGGNPLIFSTDSEGWGNNGSFVNNILISSANQGVGAAAPNITVSNNYFGSPSYGTYNAPSGSNYVNGGNPQFLSASSNCINNNCDFHIQTTSVCKDKGTDLSSLFSTDHDGNTRTGTWDIGAFEYGTSGAGSPQPPKNFRILAN